MVPQMANAVGGMPGRPGMPGMPGMVGTDLGETILFCRFLGPGPWALGPEPWALGPEPLGPGPSFFVVFYEAPGAARGRPKLPGFPRGPGGG